MQGTRLRIGEPAPWFEARTPSKPRFAFHTIAGRSVVLCFLGSAGAPDSQRILDDILQHRGLFDDVNASFFAVSVDPEDERCGRIRQSLPGLRVFWDFDMNVSRLYAADPPEGCARGFSLVLDERLRVFAVIPFDEPAQHVPRILEALAQLAPPEAPRVTANPAPVLMVPRVFEPELCRTLIRHYEAHGGEESGYMKDVNGKTVLVHDHGHKRRRDCTIEDESLRQECMARIHDRLLPEILRAFQFRATRVERFLVACYDAATSDHFRPHRDNTTRGTAHRRFAVSLVLNTGEFEGGALRFPEFGRQTCSPPAGGAVVFSCSMLHEATPVTRGKRYAFLPFLYDEAAARIREANMRFLEGNEPRPSAGQPEPGARLRA